VAVSCEHGDENSCFGTTELVALSANRINLYYNNELNMLSDFILPSVHSKGICVLKTNK
jgi:hypothetical protein